MARKIPARYVEEWVRAALLAIDEPRVLEIRDESGGVRLVLNTGQEFEVRIREAPEHPEGACGYTDGRLCWCLECAGPDDMDEYGLWPVHGKSRDLCEACGRALAKGN